jgi:uncharacterized protein (TIGR02145 family)
MKTTLLKITLTLGTIAGLCILQSCSEDEVAIAPIVETAAVSDITFSSAVLGGSITSNGGAEILAKGIAYGTTAEPTIAGDTTNQGTGSDAFEIDLTELLPNTTYYARAYATNSVGTTYGEEVEFITQAGLTVITLEASDPTYEQIYINVSVTDEGASPPTTLGVYYSKTNSVPSDSDLEYMVNGLGLESIGTGLNGLTPGTKYYFRAVAINAQGTSYSSVVELTTLALPNMTDGSGNTYPSVLINGRVWTAANLVSTKFMNGDEIPTTVNNVSGETSPVYYWEFNNIASNADTYGRMYTYYAATDTRKLCQSGWHVPTFTDINSLAVNGAELMQTGTTTWGSGVGTNTTGFNAVGAGIRYTDGSFGNIMEIMVLQSATTNPNVAGENSTKLISPLFGDYFANYAANKKYGISVRCVKD